MVCCLVVKGDIEEMGGSGDQASTIFLVVKASKSGDLGKKG